MTRRYTDKTPEVDSISIPDMPLVECTLPDGTTFAGKPIGTVSQGCSDIHAAHALPWHIARGTITPVAVRVRR